MPTPGGRAGRTARGSARAPAGAAGRRAPPPEPIRTPGRTPTCRPSFDLWSFTLCPQTGLVSALPASRHTTEQKSLQMQPTAASRYRNGIARLIHSRHSQPPADTVTASAARLDSYHRLPASHRPCRRARHLMPVDVNHCTASPSSPTVVAHQPLSSARGLPF